MTILAPARKLSYLCWIRAMQADPLDSRSPRATMIAARVTVMFLPDPSASGAKAEDSDILKLPQQTHPTSGTC